MEIFRELYLQTDADRMAAIADQVERAPPPNWARDEAAETKARTASLVGSRPTFCFSYAPDGRRPTALLIVTEKDPNTFFVSNVIPLAKHQLAHGEYNAILENFYERAIQPLASSMGVAATLSAGQVDLEHWMSHEAAELLRQFSASANRGTGSAHPADRERWNAFVVAAHRGGSTMDASDLRRWLIEVDGWAPEIADQLAVEYEYGRELLTFAEGRRSA